MAYISPSKLFIRSQGKNLLCLAFQGSGKLAIASTNEKLQVGDAKTLEEGLSAESLRELVLKTRVSCHRT